MSYSYIKSVFPNFENSNAVYDEKLYITESTGSSLNLSNMIENNLSDFSKTLPNNTNTKNNEIILPQEKLIEKYKNINSFQIESMTNTNNEYAEIKPIQSTEQNNLKYYNIESPIDPTLENKNLINKQDVKEKHFLEKFESTMNCDLYTKHIFECNKCKTIVMKQFGIVTDRIRNEEIMELISYILFGLFILMLIDYIKNK